MSQCKSLEHRDDRLKRLYVEAMNSDLIIGLGRPVEVEVTEVDGIVEVWRTYILNNKVEDVKAEIVR